MKEIYGFVIETRKLIEQDTFNRANEVKCVEGRNVKYINKEEALER